MPSRAGFIRLFTTVAMAAGLAGAFLAGSAVTSRDARAEWFQPFGGPYPGCGFVAALGGNFCSTMKTSCEAIATFRGGKLTGIKQNKASATCFLKETFVSFENTRPFCAGGSIIDVDLADGCRSYTPFRLSGGGSGGGGPSGGGSGPVNCPTGGCGGEPGGAPTAGGQTTLGAPIDPHTANTRHTFTDYRSAGPDVLDFTRYTNSTSHDRTSLGKGWSHSYSAWLSIVNTFNANIFPRRANGDLEFFRNRFGRNPWNPLFRLMTGKLFELASNTGYTYTTLNGTVETYDRFGTLLNIVRKNGYTQTMAYDAAGNLASVTDSRGRALTFTHDAAGRMTSMTDPDGRVYGYEYAPIDIGGGFILESRNLGKVVYPDDDDAPRGDPGFAASRLNNPHQTYLYEAVDQYAAITGVVDENGDRVLTWTYGAEGNGTSSEEAGGVNRVEIDYGAFPVRPVTGALGKQYEYTLTTIGNWSYITRIDRLASASTPAATRTFGYDANGWMANSTDWKGVANTYSYNTRGLQNSRTEAAGTPEARTYTTTWHAGFDVPTQIAAPERTVDMTYNASGQLLTRTVTDTTAHTVPYSTNGQTRTWTYTYNAQGLVETVDGPLPGAVDVTTFGYDPVGGVLTSVTNVLGHVTRITSHDASGRPLTMLDANGVETTMTYHARGWLLTRTADSGVGGAPATTTFDYDLTGRMTSTTLPDGSVMVYEYDAADRLTAIENGVGERIEYAYDAMGNRASQTVRAAATIPGVPGTIVRQASATFDDLGRLLQSLGAFVGEDTDYAYDANGNVISVTDPLGGVTASAFDPLDRLVTVTDALTSTAGYGYDAADNRETATDRRGLVTSYVHNGFGEVIQQSSPDTGVTVYEYDSAGRGTKRTDARGVVTDWSYDALGRMLTMTFPANPAENVTYTYDDPTAGHNGIGHVASVTDDSGSTAYRYDARGNTVRVDSVIVEQTYLTEYSYDLADRLVQIVYPSDRIVDYTRDSIGRVTGVTTKATAGAPVVTLASGGAYQAMGPLNALTYGNGVTLANGFDLDGRLAAIDAYDGATPILDLDHTFDLAGNITNIADIGGGARGRNYAYDALYRLTQGQRLPPGGGPVSSQTDYAYDAVGNRTQFTLAVPLLTGVESYTLDAFSNRLVSTEWDFGATRALTHTDSGNRATDTSTLLGSLAADYDSTDRLVEVRSGNKAVGEYLHNAMGQRVSKTAGKGSGATTHYLYDLAGMLIAEADVPRRGAASVTAEYVWLGGQPLAFVEGGTVYFVHSDHLGTPQLLTDGAAAVAWNADYAPFGLATVTGALTFNLRFPGQYFDAETGAHHNGFRTYDPSLGRYVESDPIGLGGGWNTYAYVGGNPVMRVDPFGLLPDCKALYQKTYKDNSRDATHETVLFEVGFPYPVPQPIIPGPNLDRHRPVGPSTAYDIWGAWLQWVQIDIYFVRDIIDIWVQECTDTVNDECGNPIDLKWKSPLDLSVYDKWLTSSEKIWRWDNRKSSWTYYSPPSPPLPPPFGRSPRRG